MTELTDEYLHSQGISRSLISRFWAKVNKTDSCWLWTKGMTIGGYGILWNEIGQTTLLAHRASWIINVGPIPQGLYVLHNCPGRDNPSCVNPKHLWIGTIKDNAQDSIKKGTFVYHPFKPGDEHCCKKLSGEQVREIRQLYATGQFFHKDLAERFNVSRACIGAICQCKRWRVIEGDPIHGKGQAKITANDAEQIRKMYSDGFGTQREIANLFGIGQDTVSLIVNRRTWR